MAPITPKEFLDRYTITLQDTDPFAPGIQSDTPELLGEALDVFQHSTSSQEKYEILRSFEDRKQWETLRYLTRNKGAPQEEIFLNINSILDHYKDEDHFFDNSDPWSARTSIYTSLLSLKLFLVSKKTEAVNQGDPWIYHHAATEIRSSLDSVYEYVAKRGLLTLFDTDQDGVFDDVDLFPLEVDPPDEDKDGVENTYDPKPQEASQWNPLPNNTLVETEKFDMIRKGEKTTLTVKIYLEADADIQKLEVNSFKRKTKALAEAFFMKQREANGDDIRLKMVFVDDPLFAHHQVYLHSKMDRMNSNNWDLSIVDQAPVLMHETMHLLGFPDRYHEILVSEATRDHTIEPGWNYHSAHDVMKDDSESSLILSRDLRQRIAQTWFYNSPHKTTNSEITSDISEPRFACSSKFTRTIWKSPILSWYWFLAARNQKFSQAREDSLKAFEGSQEPQRIARNLKRHPHHLAFQLEHIAYLGLKGEKEKSVKALSRLLKKYPKNIDLYLWAFNALVDWEEPEKAIHVLKRIEKNTSHPLLITCIRLNFLLKQGKLNEVEKELPALQEKYPEDVGVKQITLLIAVRKGDAQTSFSILNSYLSDIEEDQLVYIHFSYLLFNEIQASPEEMQVAMEEVDTKITNIKDKLIKALPYKLYAQWLDKRGLKEEAERAFKKASDLNPNIRLDEATLYLKHEKIPKALKAAQRYFAEYPSENGSSYQYKYFVEDNLLKANLIEEAIKYKRKHLAENLSNSTVWEETAELFLQAGKTQEALRTFAGSIKANQIIRDHDLGEEQDEALIKTFAKAILAKGKKKEVLQALSSENILPELIPLKTLLERGV